MNNRAYLKKVMKTRHDEISHTSDIAGMFGAAINEYQSGNPEPLITLLQNIPGKKP